MNSLPLPPGVEAFMDYVGVNIKLSGGFVWNERDKIKSDMMRVRERWAASRVSAEALRDKCENIGMTANEADEVVDWLRKRQAGRRLVPGYDKKFQWWQDPT